MAKIIYLDNASTTQVYGEVVKEMQKYMIEEYGNPSSMHSLGERAQKVIEDAKKVIAREIGAKAPEIIFTSGGTESNNLAIQGLAKASPAKKKIIISSIEHSSVYELCKDMKKWGYEIVEIPVNKGGLIDLNFLKNNIDNNTLLVSVMHANNEIGVIQDIRSIGKLCKERRAIFHTDAVQSFCKEKINVSDMDIDVLSGSGHKIGASKGIGFLYIKSGTKISPIILGGRQENGLRAGTENVPAIAGFSKAVSIAKRVDENKIKKLKEYFISELEKIGGKINGSKEKRLANNIHVSFSEKNSEEIMINLSENGVMCSTKSACLSKQKKKNRVLKAMGLSEKEIMGALRFSLNEFNTREEIDFVLKELKKKPKGL